MRRTLALAAMLVLFSGGCIGKGETNDPAFVPGAFPDDVLIDGIQSEVDTGDPEVDIELPGKTNYQATVALEGDRLQLDAREHWFLPTFVRTRGGRTVTVEFDNEGGVLHTFTIDEQDIDVPVTSGATAEFEVELPEEGFLRFYCAYHDQPGMQGAFVIEDIAEGGR